MEFNKENFDKLLKLNKYLSKRVEYMDIKELVGDSMNTCPYSLIEYHSDEEIKNYISESKDCNNCRQCINEFWDGVDKYLDNKYR